ncbi:hypothetical protein H9L19_04730 [Weissella diestrammenae]|uniref:Uncharacterized protein n=1 Tax=Weissella diestrammenae TaxID=1162633 RepID=A0A7G9T3Q4_9LACO|nr:hypothetical protein [Weissella diestrammenae]MCM0582711.1 hypothetical protein [Weissella diestrammenae]QNN74729.1 hypothetical protein H9L19_04730 [Weissella diestrammenae]
MNGWVKGLIIFDIVLAGCLTFYIHQHSNLMIDNVRTHQTAKKQAKNRLSTPATQFKAEDLKDTKLKSFQTANDRVKETMDLIVNSDPRQFDSSLKGQVQPSVIQQLKNELTPTVDTAVRTHQDVYVSVINEYNSPLEFYVISQNSEQLNAYEVTYDTGSKLISKFKHYSTADAAFDLKGVNQ